MVSSWRLSCIDLVAEQLTGWVKLTFPSRGTWPGIYGSLVRRVLEMLHDQQAGNDDIGLVEVVSATGTVPGTRNYSVI